MTGLEYAEEMFDAYKKAQYKIIPDAGHYSSMENPSAFASAVRDFLVSLD